MANSLIDDMYSESNNWNNGNKGRKNGSKKGLLIFFLMLLILAVIIVAIMIMNGTNKPKIVSGKTEFITYFSQGISTELVDTDNLKDVFETLKNNSSESNSNITISTNIAEIEEICDYKAQVNTKYDSNNSRGLIDINLDYLDNSIFDMQALITGKSFAIKSDEIVTKYVGYKYENLLNEATESLNNNTLGTVSSVLENFDYNAILSSITPEFVQSELDRYTQILNNIEESKFSQKEVTLKRGTGNINATAYILTLNQDELIKFSSTLLEELKYDTELISIVVQAFEATGLGIDESTIQLLIDQIIASTTEMQGDTSEIYTFTIYVSESNVLKLTLETNSMSFDVDYIFDGDNKSTVITVLEKETSSGIKIDFNNTSNDVSEQLIINLSMITGNEVITEISGEISLTGITSQTSMIIDMKFSYTDTENEFGINIETETEFKDIEVDDLTTDNCLFLDELNEEERTMVIDSIEQRTLEVLAEKQNQLNLINSNTSSSIIEGQPNSQEDDDAQKKEIAKEKLINAVANEMYVAEQNGEEYTVNDIADLEIENSELEITVVDDVATVVIDGYTFMINSVFELSE